MTDSVLLSIRSRNLAFLIGGIAAVSFTYLICFLLFESEARAAAASNPMVCGTAAKAEVTGKARLGKALFLGNCAQCHAKDMKTKLTGPPLSNWRDYFESEKELGIYVRNPMAYVKKTKNAALKQMFKEYEPTIMSSFPNMTDEEVAALVAYIDLQKSY